MMWYNARWYRFQHNAERAGHTNSLCEHTEEVKKKAVCITVQIEEKSSTKRGRVRIDRIICEGSVLRVGSTVTRRE